MPRVGDTIKLGPEPQTFALRFTTGKNVHSNFPGGRVMFTAIDERKLFMNDEEASEFEHLLLEKGVKPAEFISASRVTHGRGGGFSIRVELAEETRLESDLRRSIEMAQRRPPATQGRTTEAATPRREPAPIRQNSRPEEPAGGTSAHNSSPLMNKLCSSMYLLIDVMSEAKTYALQCGLELSPEDLRCLVTTTFINEARGGR